MVQYLLVSVLPRDVFARLGFVVEFILDLSLDLFVNGDQTEGPPGFRVTRFGDLTLRENIFLYMYLKIVD